MGVIETDGDTLIVRDEGDAALRIADVTAFVNAVRMLLDVTEMAARFEWMDGADEAIAVVKTALGIEAPLVFHPGKTWVDSWIGREIPEDAPEEDG